MPDIQTQKKQKEYEEYVKQVTPTHSLPLNMARAFLIGGLICMLGQWIMNMCQAYGLGRQISASWTSGILILLSVLLTGLNIYPKLAKFAGALGAKYLPLPGRLFYSESFLVGFWVSSIGC